MFASLRAFVPRPRIAACCLIVSMLLLAACGGGAAPTAAPAAPPAVATPGPGPTAPSPAQPISSPTSPPVVRPTATQALPPATVAPAAQATRAAGTVVSADELNSYRMKMTTWEKTDPTKKSVWQVEYVKSPPAKHISMAGIELITVGATTWTKINNRWVEQPPAAAQPGAAASGVSPDLLAQIERAIPWKEIGRETVNGVPTRHYTYAGEATLPAAVEGGQPMKVKASGQAWVLDSPTLPPVAIRSTGDSEITLRIALPNQTTRDVTIAMMSEIELSDINQPITINPPTDVMQLPVASPTRPVVAARPTVTPKPAATTAAPRPTASPVVAGAAPAGFDLGFADEFNGALGAGWETVDPSGTAELNTADRPGVLHMFADSGHDLHPDTNYDAPRLVRAVSGDFVAETRVTIDPKEFYQGAGILAYVDDQHFVRLERSVDLQGSGITFARSVDGAYEVLAGSALQAVSAARVDLRLQRSGDRFAAFWRDASSATTVWSALAQLEAPIGADVQIGLALVVDQGAPNITADFDYFRLYLPK